MRLLRDGFYEHIKENRYLYLSQRHDASLILNYVSVTQKSTNASALVCYLLSEVLVLVVRHACRHVVDDFSGGGGVVRRRLTRAAVSLKASHEATVGGEVHLKHTHTG